MTLLIKPKQEYWTNHDVAYLKGNYGVIATKMIAAKLQRSVEAVRCKAKTLGYDLNKHKATIRAGNNPESNPAITLCQTLLAYPKQPKLKWVAWNAFDSLRVLTCFGLVNDELLAATVGRHVPSLASQRRLYHWTMYQAQCLREKLIESPMLQEQLFALSGTSETSIPKEILDIVKDKLKG